MKKVKYIENFLSQDEIDDLLKIYSLVNSEIGWEESNIDYWDGRVFDIGSLMAKHPNRELYGTAIKVTKRMQEVMMDFFELDEPIYPDIVSLVQWLPGHYQPPHADNCDIDGTDNYTPWREYSGLIYLNDEFEGGQTYFPNFDMEIQPTPGGFLMFLADLEHLHGVKEIESGERKTVVSFWCHTPLNQGMKLW